MLLFLVVLAKWQEQFKGHSAHNKALAAHKRCSEQPHEGQVEGAGKAEARSDCLLIMGPIFSAAMPAELQGGTRESSSMGFNLCICV